MVVFSEDSDREGEGREGDGDSGWDFGGEEEGVTSVRWKKFSSIRSCAREREREGYKLSLSLPADVAAMRIRLIPAANVDTTWAKIGLNSHPCQRLG